MKERDLWNQEWNKRKKMRHMKNRQMLDKVWYKGEWIEKGIAMGKLFRKNKHP